MNYLRGRFTSTPFIVNRLPFGRKPPKGIKSDRRTELNTAYGNFRELGSRSHRSDVERFFRSRGCLYVCILGSNGQLSVLSQIPICVTTGGNCLVTIWRWKLVRPAGFSTRGSP